MFAPGTLGHRESVREIIVKCSMQANWFSMVTFVKETVLSLGRWSNERSRDSSDPLKKQKHKTKQNQRKQKSIDYIPDPALATGTQQTPMSSFPTSVTFGAGACGRKCWLPVLISKSISKRLKQFSWCLELTGVNKWPCKSSFFPQASRFH